MTGASRRFSRAVALVWGFSRGTMRIRGLYSPWNSPGKNTGVDCHSLLHGDLPNPGIEPESPVLQADFLPSEPPGKLNELYFNFKIC